MKRLLLPLSIVALAVIFVLGGCGDSTSPEQNEQNNSTGLVRGEIDPASTGFEVVTETAGDPDFPIPGPYIIRGKNVHYVDSLQVLSVDFTVEHRYRCRCEFLEPVSLTFINLLPPGVTVENPDNDVNGPGAAIVFEFENDDGVWSPFEESLPRTVHFGVDPGVSIGFVARIDFGQDDRFGSIGGVVFHDVNENGIIDPDESGVGGVEILMHSLDGPETAQPEIAWRTVTDREGGYRFDGLDAGHYKVSTPLRPGLRPTTPLSMDVILVERDGRVEDFLMANFGVVVTDPQPPLIAVGDYVWVSGRFSRSKDDEVRYRFDAAEILVRPCSNEPPTQDVFRRCRGFAGAMCGPVTAIDPEKRVLDIMGTPVFFEVDFDTIPDDSTYYADLRTIDGQAGCDDCIDFDDVAPGDRICADVIRIYTFADGPQLIGLRMRLWDGTDEKLTGPVERVRTHDDGRLAGIRVLDTAVYISDDTVIRLLR
jgi:hypothetical protein